MEYVTSTWTITIIFLLDFIHSFIKIKLYYKNQCCTEE